MNELSPLARAVTGDLPPANLDKLAFAAGGDCPTHYSKQQFRSIDSR